MILIGLSYDSDSVYFKDNVQAESYLEYVNSQLNFFKADCDQVFILSNHVSEDFLNLMEPTIPMYMTCQVIVSYNPTERQAILSVDH